MRAPSSNRMPQILTDDTRVGTIHHAWQVSEYERHERGRTWYIVMGIIALLLIFYALKTQNFLFALIIILAGIILYVQSHQEPLTVQFAIADAGIIVNNRFYAYGELTSFYLVYNSEVKTLFFETKSALRPMLRISLLDADPDEITDTLRKYLPEKEGTEDEPTTDVLARRWKIQ